ncbi:hypothetical protein G9P44_005933 [Scheffersomyces stipitis]|nr:hypothetical protein G9P44_005933 [Scheffersomyces stipitis]
MDDNPLLVQNRLSKRNAFPGESLPPTLETPPASRSSSSTSFFSLHNLLHYLQISIYHIYVFFSTKIRSNLPQQPRATTPPLDQSSDIDIMALDLDDEESVQIISVHKITNDYHLLRQPKNNSMIASDISQISSDNNSVNVLQKYSESRFNRNGVSEDPRNLQYGTSLSLSNNYLKSSSYQKEYTPEPNFEGVKRERIKLSDYSQFIKQEPQISEYKKSILNYYIPSSPVSITNYSIVDKLIPHYYVDKISAEYDRKRIDNQKIIEKSRLDSLSKITPLGPQELQKVQAVWQSSRTDTFATNYQIELYFHDLKTLRDGKWLNDNIIDYYLNLIMESQNQKVFGWTTHFYTTLETKGYSGVARWAKRKKINLFEKKKILVPINILNTHWALAVIDNVDKSIRYYDSLSSSGNENAMLNLKDYMKQEASRLNVPVIDYELYPHMETPQQANGYDCGVFTCTAAKYIALSKSLTYSQKDMKVIRRRMTYEIISSRLLD